jgi:hypothetical protein
MLSERYNREILSKQLPEPGTWHPFPTIQEREEWEALPSEVRKTLLDKGEELLGHEWPALPATLFLEYARHGNRSRYQNVRYARRYNLRDLVLAECVEGEGRFLDDIVNGIWATCEESYWGVPAHLSMQEAGSGLPDVEEPTVDLFAAETVALLAWSLYLLGDTLDEVSPLVLPRIRYEATRRVLDPCLEREDFWWMAFNPGSHSVNNWNPWINSNWLATTLLLEDDSERQVAAVHKVLRSLDIFLGIYGEAGGCDEGPGYWGRAAASLFDCLEWLYKATNGGVNVYDEIKIKNMGRFIYQTHIHDHYFVNFADASAINHPPAGLIYRYGKRIEDDKMAGFGGWLMGQIQGDIAKQSRSLGRLLPNLFEIPRPLDVEPTQPLPRDAWFDDIQVMVARDQGGTAEGLFVAAKGGHNSESHNHNDVGNVIVYVDGKPLIVDAGVETYRRKTFSPQRYEIWTMQSAYHTLLPTVDEVMQAPGSDFKAGDVKYEAGDDQVTYVVEVSDAYPDEAELERWQRTLTVDRGESLVIEDVYEFVSAPDTLTMSLLTPCEVEVESESVVFKPTTFGPEDVERQSAAGKLTFDDVLNVDVEEVPITDDRLGGVWGEHLNRVVFEIENPSRKGRWAWTITP